MSLPEEKRNLLISQLANAQRAGMSNATIRQMCYRILFQCELIETEYGKHINAATMESLLLEPHQH